MLGNEAIARGAWEAGARVVSSYPGTPSTEITEAVARYPGIYAEWAANEKVGLEVAVGASLGGARAMSCMKHVGLNVAADPLYTAAYTGVNAGLLVVVADDPGMHSSQNEQDSRFHARASMTPMLEPSDSQECLDFAKLAFELSERYDTPVLLRTTTRIAHARSPVTQGERAEFSGAPYKKDIQKNVMMPGMARGRHILVEKRMDALARDGADMPINRLEMRDAKVGVVCSGIAYQYVREALPGASTLKLGLVNPLPRALIERFAAQVESLYVIEELEPVFEEQIASWGIRVTGKALTGRQGELSVNAVRRAFGLPAPEFGTIDDLPARPPLLCPGCPHRGPFSVIQKLKLSAMGDIGCYTMAALPPLSALDTSLCMGASVGMAQGMARADAALAQKTVAVIGDSTFLHSGLPSLISAAYNGADLTLLILDNSTTAMTGHQQNPATGLDLHGAPAAAKIDLEALCRAAGASSVRTLDAYDLKGLEAALREETARKGASVIIARRPCVLLDKKAKYTPYQVDPDRCRACGLCGRIGCPAIERRPDRKAWINPSPCVGCGLCAQLCPFSAIRKAGEQA
ncbi:MAG: indolepyruvate ferredoxin oxidoreductase subunit alpha [Clostridiales bacterium]|nr:indolepyruvate ferredoxin oxidoreductase subunit alpha [Clostridiales bacterium]